MNPPSILEITTTIFFVFNAIGNIPLFITLLHSYNPKRRLRITFRETIVALVIMLLFCFFGRHILDFIGISLVDVKVGGGAILFLISLAMLFPKPAASGSSDVDNEPFIVPLAIPILTGPGTISSIMLFVADPAIPTLSVLVSIFLAWLPSMLLLVFASFLQRVLGRPILLALERLMGFILLLIAIEMMSAGSIEFVQIVKSVLS